MTRLEVKFHNDRQRKLMTWPGSPLRGYSKRKPVLVIKQQHLDIEYGNKAFIFVFCFKLSLLSKIRQNI